jgi:hypothetical protein
MQLALIKNNGLTQGILIDEGFLGGGLQDPINVPSTSGTGGASGSGTDEGSVAKTEAKKKQKKVPGATAAGDPDPRPQVQQPTSTPEPEPAVKAPKPQPVQTTQPAVPGPAPGAEGSRQLSLGQLLEGGKAGLDTFQRPGQGVGRQAFQGRAIGSDLNQGVGKGPFGLSPGGLPAQFGRLPLTAGAGTSADVVLGGQSDVVDNPLLNAILRQG